MVSVLLSITFACGVFIAVAHVVNTRFVAPVYDAVANLVAFLCAVAASALLHHWVPALLAAVAVGCWTGLSVRTWKERRRVSAANSAVGDLACTCGRPDGALPQLQHADALGDLPREV